MFDYFDYKDNLCRAYNIDEKKAAPFTMPEMRYAQAYVPFQQFGPVFPPDKALMHGTIFPDLFRPYTGREAINNSK